MRIRLILLLPGLLLSTGMLMILFGKYLSILTSGLMVVERISLLLEALRLLVLVFTSLLLKLPLIMLFGARLKNMVMLGLSVAVLFYLSLYCKLFSVLNSGVLFLLCRLTGRSIGRLLDADCIAKPLPLVKDADLVTLVQYMIRTRGRDTVRVTKVKGHAEDVDVQQGRVRLVDKQGNAEADVAADLGRRHQSEVLIDARRRLLGARSHWYPIMTDLHRFMAAIARVSVNHDGKGGTAPDPLVWDQGSRPKVRKLHIRVNVDLASLPGLPGFLNSSWIQVDAGHITGADISAWPYSVGILVRFTSFLRTLHWPSGSVDLGHFGISFLELLILFEQWAGHRLLSEKVTRPHIRAGRPISVSSVPVSEGIEIRHGCQFLSSLIRALGKLPGGLGRFLPCDLGAHLSGKRHVGWNQCSHGLNSRPLESCHHQCLEALCGVFGIS